MFSTSHRHHALRIKLYATVLLTLASATYVYAQDIVYVNVQAAPGGDGTSWTTAYDNLHTGLSDAAANPDVEQIWVAAGTYASDGTPFQLLENIEIYGGFAGNETNLDQRDVETNLTILDGSAGGPAVVEASVGDTARLDGFTITSTGATRGINAATGSPLIANCEITDNTASTSGGGVYFASGAPIFTRCRFSLNTTNNRGGAVYVASGSAQFTNCIFHNNTAFSGGGIGTNTASVTCVNCLWYENEASSGAAGYTFSGSLMLANCTVVDNVATTAGGGLFATLGTSRVDNSIVFGNTAPNYPQIRGTFTVSYSCIEGGYDGAGNIASNPDFINREAADYRITPHSACIDAGDNSAVPTDVLDLDGDGNTTERIPVDLFEHSRFADVLITPDTGLPELPDYPNIVDMGVFEEQDDCNGNGVSDALDIVNGTSLDCNENGVPDECEVAEQDCNGNGIPDDCDLGGPQAPEYVLDDGSFEDAAGLTNGGMIIWLNQFNVHSGAETLGGIRVACAGVPLGTALTVYIWSDPNQDTNPLDAVLETSVTSAVLYNDGSTFNYVAIPPTYVGEVGDSFFIGAMLHHEAGLLPATVDTSENLYRSWIFAGSTSVDPTDLAAAPASGTLGGNALIRAVSADTPANDCNANGVPDECDIAAGTSFDCQPNGVPDECELLENDCNGNNTPDECDIANGTSDDCQADGVPDECQMYDPNQPAYRYDDGTTDNRIGVSPDAHIAWFNQFFVTEQLQEAAAVEVAFGTIPEGLDATFYIWSDPDGDGDPTDAQVIVAAPTHTAQPDSDFFCIATFEPVFLGEVGTSFFAGVILRCPDGYHPCAQDQSDSTGRSWIIANDATPPDADYPIDPNDLLHPYPTQVAGRIDQDYNLPGDWLIHVLGWPANDCNQNGILDSCDLADGLSQDLNANGLPDECDLPGDVNGDGLVDFVEFAQFADCMNGPEQPNPGCDPINFALNDADADEDVDIADFAEFQTAFTGTER